MQKFFKNGLLFALGATIFLSSCKKESVTGPGTVIVEFDHRWGTQAFKLGEAIVTPANDTATFSMLKYYLSNVKLLNTNGSEYVIPNSYYLIDQDSTNSQTLSFKDVPAGNYSGISFTIGVDSAKSVSPIDQRTGVLDPATGGKGMYWAWNSGYIFVKMEGTSPAAPLDSATQKRFFKYHIGGFGGYSSKTINNLKTVGLKSSGEAAEVNTGNTPVFHLITDVKEFFQNPNTLSIRSNPVVMFAAYSTSIANNYQDMIRLDHIHN